MPDTPDPAAEILRLDREATPAPWYWDECDLRAAQGRWKPNALLASFDEMPCAENRAWIQHVRTLAPAVAREVLALRERLAVIGAESPIDAVDGFKDHELAQAEDAIAMLRPHMDGRIKESDGPLLPQCAFDSLVAVVTFLRRLTDATREITRRALDAARKGGG